jgi:aromatic-L-amino-acid decarboxylase
MPVNRSIPANRPESGQFAAYLGWAARALDAHLDEHPGDAMRRFAEWDTALKGNLPEVGSGTDAAVQRLLEVVLPNGPRMSHPGFWGWITTGPSTVGAVASAVASVAGPQRYTITAFNRVEELSLDWLAELCGLGEDMKGVYSSGGSTANLIALGAARQWAFTQRGIDPAASGVDGTPVAIYTSTEAHHTIHRSAGVLGLGRRSVRLVPIDERQRMRVDALAEMMERDQTAGITPVAVVAAAGTTNTGAIDPLRAVGELAREHGAWFHVDGAYGLPGILDPRVADLYDGLELADSVIVDPHKWLGAPVGVAATFVRDRSLLFNAFMQEPADYLEGAFVEETESSLDAMGIPYQDFGVELSAPSRGVIVWAILTELGREGMAARIIEDNGFARQVADRARSEPALELLTEPTLSIACFRHVAPAGSDADEFNQRLLRRLLRETDFMPSSTIVDGDFAIRPCFINVRTTAAHVDAFLDAVLRIGAEQTLQVPS